MAELRLKMAGLVFKMAKLGLSHGLKWQRLGKKAEIIFEKKDLKNKHFTK